MNRGSYPRRYDLDALRATAMLLGIALHAGLSFTPFPWAVQDERQSGFFWFLFAAIHGFRMPVFFVLSGFFTAMLWRGRGLKPVLSHRFRRVLLPFLLGLVTIVPAVNWISGWAIASRLEANAAKAEEDNIWSAAKNGDLAAIERHLQGGADINGIDPAFGQTPLVWAALVGQLEVVDWLLQNGAAVNGRTKDGGTPLHAAAFLGRVEVAKLLLQYGADPEAKNNNGDTPRTALEVDWELTRYLAGLLQIELDARQVEDGRVEIAGLFGQSSAGEGQERTDKAEEKSAEFLKAMASPIFAVPLFHHLWFLWFLCWLVLVFALYARLADWLQWQGPPKWLVLSPVRFLYLIPLTMIPHSRSWDWSYPVLARTPPWAFCPCRTYYFTTPSFSSLALCISTATTQTAGSGNGGGWRFPWGYSSSSRSGSNFQRVHSDFAKRYSIRLWPGPQRWRCR